MGNLTTLKQVPDWVTTPLLTLSQTPQQRSKHRAWIAVKAEAALHGYWKNDPDPVVKSEMMIDWMEGLENYHEGEIRAAFKCHLADNPKIRPNVGYIRKYIMANRELTAPKIAPVIEPERPEPTANQKARADNILRDAGFKPNKRG